jgi:hypothetical protein
MTMPSLRGAAPLGRASAPAAALALALAVALAACSSAGGTATSVPSGTPPTAGAAPSDGASGPIASPGGDLDPAGSGPVVVPRPGQLDVHPIAAGSFTARVDGRHVVLTITYTSGVEPCSVLDTIVVQRGTGSFAITLREGHGPGNPVCIMIAKVMTTRVDLGELDPGTYLITDATGGADPIQVIVS